MATIHLNNWVYGNKRTPKSKIHKKPSGDAVQ